jgi:C4-dicarboxylate-specific signal transduction histidine kinase
MCFLVCIHFYLLDKAQEVEAELLESHQEEINQLHKKIAEKDDDLKRTAKRYL